MNWNEICRLPRKEIEELQNRKLRAFIRNQLYPHSPYYRRLFREKGIDPYEIRTKEDLRKIPFTTKEDIAPTRENPKKPEEFILKGEGEEYKPIYVTFTTGRTAAPTPIFYTRYDIEKLRENTRRRWNLMEAGDSPLLSLMPYSLHIAFLFGWHMGDANEVFSIHTGGGRVMGTEGIISNIERFRPGVIYGIPGYTYHLMRTAAGEGRDFSSIKRVIIGAERVPPGLREKIRGFLEEMGAKDPLVLTTYGFSEQRGGWQECAAEFSGCHTYPDIEVIEIIDPDTGEVLGEEETGEVVYSAIDWRGTCVLRYRTGDIVEGGMTLEKCEHCGRTVPRLGTDIKRRSDMKEFKLEKVKGTLVDMNAFFPTLTNIRDIDEWQVEIRKKNNDPYEVDEIVVYVAPKPGSDLSKLKNEIKKELMEKIEVSPNEIVFCSLEEVLDRLGMEKELKEKRVLDLRREVSL
ncbi:MAG: phenylacetate--CoA ligase family protein [Candidatus Syntropharchaeia archaeon]